MQNPKNHLKGIAILIVVLFAIQLVNVATRMHLSRFGIIPRTVVGLRGIVFSPLLHGNWGHLLANVGALAVLLVLLSFNKKNSLWSTTGAIWVIAGLATWFVGRPGSVQIGASGLIYGVATYLITAAFIYRDLFSGFIAFLVVVAYGGLVWGLLPIHSGVSWEGHLCGAIAGIVVASFSRKRGR